MAELVIDESGMADVKLGGTVVPVDLYYAANSMSAIYAEAKSTVPDAASAAFQVEFQSKLVAFIETLGFGPVSHFVADQFYDKIVEASNQLGKTRAVGPTPA